MKSQGIKRVGIFGGSFNPPHLGHLLAAVYAQKVFGLDEVWFVPAYRHAFQKDLMAYPLRLRMCKALVKDLGSRFKVSTIERDMRSDGKMLHTLQALRKKNRSKRFCLVIGSDLIKETKRWYRFPEIKKDFGVLIVPRGKSVNGTYAIPDISSTEVRRRMKNKKTLASLLTPEVARLL